MSAYEIVWFHGHRFDRMTVQALLEMERRLGYQLSIMQGSYNGTAVGASAGTHAGGGAVDLSPVDAQAKQRVGREVGFAMWERPTLPDVWEHHVHGILIGNAKVSPSAAHQITQYRNGTNGLANFGADHSWRPSPIRPFVYRGAPAVPVAVDLSNLRIDFENAIHGNGGNAPYGRVRRVQRRLAAKGIRCAVDGVVGPQTLGAWKAWERKNGDSTPNSLPDAGQLKALLKGSIYYMVP